MKQSSILAHRGWFLDATEKNSKDAIKRALENGFGLETDVRDHNGVMVLSHDPPSNSCNPPRLEWLLELIFASSYKGRIALNIKADGLKDSIEKLFKATGLVFEDVFVFDMSVPDSPAYIDSAIPTYMRMSEYELEPAFLGNIQGVWVDNFTGYFPQVERAKSLMDKGIRAAIVSPELHMRDHKPLWNKILESGIHNHPLFELCTDFPREAATLFCNS